MKLNSVAIVNRSRSNVKSITVHDLDVQFSTAESDSAPAQAEIEVRSEKHGDKYVPVHGWPRSDQVRVSIAFESEEAEVWLDLRGSVRASVQRLFFDGPHASQYQAFYQQDGGKTVLTILDAGDSSIRPDHTSPSPSLRGQGVQAHAPTSWMADVADGKTINELSIPGTHNTCAFYGGPLIQCQRMSLREQLTSGVRFLDIRCKNGDDKLWIYHNSSYQYQEFGTDVRDICAHFLHENPSECIIMSVKEEGKLSGSTRSFADSLLWYMKLAPDLWFIENRAPQLGEVRGKIVLFRRFGSTSPLGINASNWPDDQTFNGGQPPVKLRVQDGYWVPTLCDISKKWGRVKTLLDDSQNDDGTSWYINFTSGVSGGCYPNAVAFGSPGFTGVNYSLADYLAQNKANRRRIGTIVMDFPEDPERLLIPSIYRLNFTD